MIFSEFSILVSNYAKENSIKEYELYYQADISNQLGSFSGEIDRMSGAKVEGVSLRCIVNGRSGTASTENLSEEEIPILFDRALEAAQFGTKSVSLFNGDSDYKSVEKVETKFLDVKGKKDLLLSIGQLAQSKDSRIEKGITAGIADIESKFALSNSTGLYLENSGKMTVLSIEMVARDDNERRYNNFMTKAMASVSNFDINAFVDKAVKKTVSQIGGYSIGSGHYPVILDASQMTMLLEVFSCSFSASRVQDNLSLLNGKLESKIASTKVTIVDDPFYEDNFFQSPFDAEGVQTFKKNIIENGILKTFLYDRTSAERDGVESTGNAYRESYDSPITIAPFTLYMKSGEYTQEELMGKADKAILVTFMKGAHAGANAVTGDFSLESKGFLVEKGKIIRPIEEFTVSGNFFRLLENITAVGNDLNVSVEDGISCCGAPSVLVSDLAVAGC